MTSNTPSVVGYAAVVTKAEKARIGHQFHQIDAPIPPSMPVLFFSLQQEAEEDTLQCIGTNDGRGGLEVG